MTRRLYIFLLMACIASLAMCGQVAAADTMAEPDTAARLNKITLIKQHVSSRFKKKMSEPYDTVRDSGYWWRALKHGKVDLDGGSIDYPRFVRFAWKTYKWGDRAFNSYDTAYVVSTGKNWKLVFKSMNWLDAYGGEPVNDTHIFVSSRPSSSVGLQLSFMAVSAGFTMGVSDWIHGENTSKKLDFSFTCARFAADAFYMKNTGKTLMKYRHSGDEKDSGTIHSFNGLYRKSYGLSAYYFFNNRRYAQAAAYCYSKYQKRSAGSFIAGICLVHRDMSFDATLFPDIVKQRLPNGVEMPHFLYNDYCLMAGYGHNWVLGRKWLLNLTVTPYAGYRRTMATSHEEKGSAFSANMRARMASVYNLNRFFVGLQAYADIHHYNTGNYFFTGSILDFTALAGIRF